MISKIFLFFLIFFTVRQVIIKLLSKKILRKISK